MTVEHVGTVIVGAGVCGLKAASRLSRDGHTDFVVLERSATIGGVWSTDAGWANASSRVQISEPNYRLIEENVTTEFTPQEELLGQMKTLVAEGNFEDRIRYGSKVTSVRTVDAAGEETLHDDATASVRVAYVDPAGRIHILMASEHVLLCTGGLQTPNRDVLPSDVPFAGTVISGVNSEVDAIPLGGKSVCVVGMGAFAVENARTALEQGAEHVTIVARGMNLVLPRMLLAQGSVAGGANLYRKREDSTDPASVERMRMALQTMVTPYQAVGASELMPDGLREAVKGNSSIRDAIGGGTVPTASDFFFIAVALGRISVIKGEVKSFVRDGVRVAVTGNTEAIEHVACDLVVKCLGFEKPDAHLGAMTGRERIFSPLWLAPKILLMKGERNPSRTSAGVQGQEDQPPAASGAERGGFNVGGSVIAMSDLYLEIYAYFRDHPDELAAVLPQLPHPKVFEDSYQDFGDGSLTILELIPKLEPQIEEVRAKYTRQVESRGGLADFLAQNRADWRKNCKLLTGDENAVPYIWDDMIKARAKSAMPRVLAPLIGLVPVTWLMRVGTSRSKTKTRARL